jgi:hypothetical protein
MALDLQKLVLAIVVTTVIAFTAGLEAGWALANQPQAQAAPAPTVTSDPSATDYSAPPRLCPSSLGPEGYETCRAYIGEHYP